MCTEKQSVAAYFDRLAAGWDEANTYSDNTILQILDLADIRPGVHVLDVGCGTGARFPDYLCRGASSVTGVDLSPGMITQAEKKFRQPEIHLIRADILACRFDHPFDQPGSPAAPVGRLCAARRPDYPGAMHGGRRGAMPGMSRLLSPAGNHQAGTDDGPLVFGRHSNLRHGEIRGLWPAQ